MDQIPYPLRTERLVLRRFEPADLDAYYAYQSLPETARYLLGEARSLAECMERIGKFNQQKFSQEGDWASFAVELVDQPGLLGEIAFKWEAGGDAEHGYVGEIGWTLAPQAQGKGYATEAANAVLDLAFGQLGFHRVHARLDAVNVGSRKICERIGMQREALLRENWYLKGEWSTEAIYAILRSDWQASKR